MGEAKRGLKDGLCMESKKGWESGDGMSGRGSLMWVEVDSLLVILLVNMFCTS